MGNFLLGFVLPVLLLMAAFLNWSLISLVDLIAFLFLQFSVPKIDYEFRWMITAFCFIMTICHFVYSSDEVGQTLNDTCDVEAALLNWSLISLVDLIAFLLLQFSVPKIGTR